MMRKKIHAAAGVAAFLIIALFWTSTVISELFGTFAVVAMVKAGILRGMIVLIPALAIVGASGMSMGLQRKDELAMRKKQRMPLIALNGLIVLVPSAFFLAARSAAGAMREWETGGSWPGPGLLGPGPASGSVRAWGG